MNDGGIATRRTHKMLGECNCATDYLHSLRSGAKRENCVFRDMKIAREWWILFSLRQFFFSLLLLFWISGTHRQAWAIFRVALVADMLHSLHSIHNAPRLYQSIVPAILSPKHVPTVPFLSCAVSNTLLSLWLAIRCITFLVAFFSVGAANATDAAVCDVVQARCQFISHHCCSPLRLVYSIAHVWLGNVCLVLTLTLALRSRYDWLDERVNCCCHTRLMHKTEFMMTSLL